VIISCVQRPEILPDWPGLPGHFSGGEDMEIVKIHQQAEKFSYEI